MLNNENARENYNQVDTQSTPSTRGQIYEEFAPRPFECAGILDRLREKKKDAYMLKIRNGEHTAIVSGMNFNVVKYGLVYCHVPSKKGWYLTSFDRSKWENLLVFDRFQNTLRYSFFDGVTEYSSKDDGFLFAYFEVESKSNKENFIVSVSSFPRDNANIGGIISGTDPELFDYIIASLNIVTEETEHGFEWKSEYNQ